MTKARGVETRRRQQRARIIAQEKAAREEPGRNSTARVCFTHGGYNGPGCPACEENGDDAGGHDMTEDA